MRKIREYKSFFIVMADRVTTMVIVFRKPKKFGHAFLNVLSTSFVAIVAVAGRGKADAISWARQKTQEVIHYESVQHPHRIRSI